MSRIIKAEEAAQCTSFNFVEIEEGNRTRLCAPASEGESRGVETGSEPISALEKSVQNRLLEIERRAQEIESEAYEKGYAQGLKDGAEYGRKSMEVVKDHLERLLGEMRVLPHSVMNDYRHWLTAACLTISKRIVRRELETRPEAITALVDSIMQEAQEGHAITIHVHPKDLDLLNKHTAFQSMLQQYERPLALKPDSTISRGGCRLETDIQLLDANVDAQFALIEEAFARHVFNSEEIGSE